MLPEQSPPNVVQRTYARFIFNMANGPALEKDLPGVAEAKCEAARYLGRMICEEAAKLWETGDLFLAVSDDKGLVMFTLEVIGHDASALRIEMPQDN